jgi:hypothetical protein
MALAEVARFATLSEAHVLVAALRSGGIPAEVFDGELGQMDWPLQQALGGFRVFVPEETAADARAFLATVGEAQPPDG